MSYSICSFFFFFNDTATTEIYTLSLHDALPISSAPAWSRPAVPRRHRVTYDREPDEAARRWGAASRSEEHTSELQSPCNLVCRLLLEKKKYDIEQIQPRMTEHTQRTRHNNSHDL